MERWGKLKMRMCLCKNGFFCFIVYFYEVFFFLNFIMIGIWGFVSIDIGVVGMLIIWIELGCGMDGGFIELGVWWCFV